MPLFFFQETRMMSDKAISDRRAILTTIGGTALLGAIGANPARAQEANAGKYGYTLDRSDLAKEVEIGKKGKLEDPRTTSDIEVLPYELLGGPIVFHGKVYVDKTDNNKTTTQGEVSQGPEGGPFDGVYRLTKAN